MTEKKVSTVKVLTWLSIILGVFLVVAVIVAMQAPKEIIIEKEIIKEVIVEVEVPAPVELVEPIEPTIIEKIGYLIDELFLSDPLEIETYSDREINLFDGKVEFDGDDYDAEETLILKDIELVANENDYEGNVYMNVPKEAIEYKLTFENDLNTSLIDEDETLEFNFLGEKYEVSSWIGGEIKLTKGTQMMLKEGETFVVDDKTVLLEFVIEEDVWVDVNGVGKKISDGQTKTVNGIEIKVQDIFEGSSDGVRSGFATLTIGEDVEVTIEHKDEYEEDSAWEYVIIANSIGIILVEEHSEVDLDGDEEFQAVGEGLSLCLPNDYVCVQFNGMSNEDTEEYNLELDEEEGTKVRIDGNFESGTKDYDRIYVNATGIYDREMVLISNESVELGDTESILLLREHENETTRYIEIEDFAVEFTLDDAGVWDWILEKWNDINSKEDDYLTDFGVLVINPENSAENQEFEISVPEEKISGSIRLI